MPTNFLDLPSEIRRQIYHASLSPQLLRVQDIREIPRWDLEPLAGIPSLLLVNKAISEEAASVFYSKAVLHVAPPRPPSYLFDSLHGKGPNINLAYGLDVAFASCPRRHMKRITTACISSAHYDAINAEGYEALLRWLVDYTAVRTVYLSIRLLTRLRTARTDVDSMSALCAAASSLSLQRTIYVYAYPSRSKWELTRMDEIKKALNGSTLPDIQAYVVEQGRQSDALLDPRWDLRRNSSGDDVEALRSISTWLDSLLAADIVTKQAQSAHPQEESRKPSSLYQICFVFHSRQPLDEG
jgi:hypothetical protein